MSQSFHDTTRTLDVLGTPLAWVARLAARVRARLALARTRKVVRALDDAQLADAGIDPSTVVRPRPTIEVEAGLMARLMTMQ